jgi:hypothetical protein
MSAAMTTYLPKDQDLDLESLADARAVQIDLCWPRDEAADVLLNLDRAAGFHAALLRVLRGEVS